MPPPEGNPVPRFKLSLEYVGTRYSGWQIQKNARTIQGELQQAARPLSRGYLELYGAGRTDAGVHALGQVAHLDLDTNLPPEALRHRLNDVLPADINVLHAARVSRRFHARHSALARSYLYQVSRRRTAFGKAFVWWVKDELDDGAMQEAARHFTGLHDFRAFAAADPEGGSTRVKVENVQLRSEGDLILLRVVGSHFLWKMVRRMVGVLVEVGRGSLAPLDIAGFLSGSSTQPSEFTAPPSGLFLERVFYEGDATEFPLQGTLALPTGDGAKGRHP
jgi:tRNA pseudouridine38-40 synthase